MGPDEDILRLSISYGKHFLEQNNPDIARYFLSIAYDLTDDEEIGKALENLPEDPEN
jgi:hypothetical protein